MACRTARRAGASRVETLTAFGLPSAEDSDVWLMRATVGRSVDAKAGGRARTLEDRMRMLISRPERLGSGTSARLTKATGHTD